MTATVVIGTYNGEKKIPILLDCLLRQNVVDFEVIVVIDGSTDDTEAVLNSFKGRFGQFRVIVQENRGRAAVRNRGAKEAQSGLLIFYDDDMSPDEFSVCNHINFHTGGRQALLSGHQFEPTERTKTDIQNYKAFISARWFEKYKRTLTALDSSNLFFTAANCSMPLQVFTSLNGFDDRLTDAEDVDLARRALKNGIPVFLDISNVAIHRDNITCAGYIARLRQYAAAQIRLKEINPEQETLSKKESPFRRFVYFFFASPLLVRLIDRGRFWMLPKVLRYKLYEIVIHALSIEFPKIELR